MKRRRSTRRAPAEPPAFVLDCSVVFAWYFADEANDYADSVALNLHQTKALVPSLWALEVANTLVMGERRQRSTQSHADSFLSALSKLPISIDNQTAQQAWTTTIALARKYTISSYDAAYLELSMRESIPLATLDDKLKAAAKAAGLQIYEP